MTASPAPVLTRLDRRVARVLACCAWLRPGSTLLVGVSGGPDSTALLYALVCAADSRGLRLFVVHVDHGIRRESGDDAQRVRALAATVGVRCLVLRGGPRIARGGPLGRAGGLEQAAREARYTLLARAARRTGAAAIAIAHTIEDQAETVLLRLLRGTGPRGLGGMRPVARLYGARILRPMLDTSREEVAESLVAHGATPVRDASNDDLTRERNWLRHEILPALAQRWGASLPRRIARMARLARASADAEEQLAAAAYAVVASHREPSNVAPTASSIALDGPRLASYSHAVQRSVVRHALRELAGTLSGFSLAHVTRILALASPPPQPERASRATDLPHGLRVTVQGTDIVLAARVSQWP